MDLVALKTRLLVKLVPIRRDESECMMTVVPRSCLFRPGSPLPEIGPCEGRDSKKEEYCFSFLLFFHHLPPFFDQNAKTTFLIERRGLLIIDIFCHFWPFFFDQKAPFFDQKILVFSSTFSPFSHHGECGPHLFSQRRYRPTSYQGARDLRKFTQTHLFLSFFRQTGTGPRPTHCGPQGKLELCVIVIVKGKREFMMFACVSVCGREGERERRGGGVVVRCAVLCVWTLCLWCDVCVGGVCDV